jgi:hypothetical protein
MSISTPGSNSSPGPVRTLSRVTPGPSPPRIMVPDIIAAPALVPPSTIVPERTRLCSAESVRVPPSTVVIRSWSPPVKKTPVAVASAATTAGSLAWDRCSSRSPRTRPAPRWVNRVAYSASRTAGSVLAVAITISSAARPPASSTKRRRMPVPPEP